MGYRPSALGASAGRGPGSRAPSRKASRHLALIPSRDHESLAGGTRLRVPPSFHSGVRYHCPSAGAFLTGLATAVGPASRRGSHVGAMLTLLRLPLSSACASLRRDLSGPPGWASEIGASSGYNYYQGGQPRGPPVRLGHLLQNQPDL